jgi:multiple sugar transport system substrate-binding protein
MTKPIIRATVAVAATAVLAATLVGCSGGATDGKVTITVGNRPTASEKESRVFFDKQVKEFEKANPNITIKASEAKYDPTSFQAFLAGGKLPDVLQIPFTDIQEMISQKEVADVTDQLKATGVDKELSATLLPIGQDSSKHTYGIPVSAYTLGLIYNRDLFTKAGLDPDKPPTTWDEVRADAKKITDATGVPGYSQMATENTGGWMFTGISYSYGGRIENAGGTKAVFDDTQSEEALQALHDMRWVDHSVGENALFNYDGINQAFGTEKLGMFVGGADMYWASVVNNKMNKEHFAITGMPQAGGQKNGTLLGGAVEIVNPKASDAEKLAAVKWVDWFYLRQFHDKKIAVDNTKATAAAGGAAGLPGLPILSDSAQAQYNAWIKPYATVPLSNFEPYLSTVKDIPLIPEPKAKAQDVYAALDSVIQAVLSDQGSDIKKLLTDAQSQVDAKLSR